MLYVVVDQDKTEPYYTVNGIYTNPKLAVNCKKTIDDKRKARGWSKYYECKIYKVSKNEYLENGILDCPTYIV